MVLFLEYLVFSAGVFCTEQLQIICRICCEIFFAILIFDPKSGFCMGMMADFQNGLISRLFSNFGSRFLHRAIPYDL